VAQDTAGFAGFYQASRDRCLRAVQASVGDRELAEDLVAEGFVRALMAWPKVSRHPAPEAWVVRTAMNTRITWWRRADIRRCPRHLHARPVLTAA
jgi:DNA-directed RNA polymerase specialized sigma24 family protein